MASEHKRPVIAISATSRPTRPRLDVVRDADGSPFREPWMRWCRGTSWLADQLTGRGNLAKPGGRRTVNSDLLKDPLASRHFLSGSNKTWTAGVRPS